MAFVTLRLIAAFCLTGFLFQVISCMPSSLNSSRPKYQLSFQEQVKALWFCHLTSGFSLQDFQNSRYFCLSSPDVWSCGENSSEISADNSSCTEVILNLSRFNYKDVCGILGDSSALNFDDLDVNNFTLCTFNNLTRAEHQRLVEVFQILFTLPFSPYNDLTVERMFNECVESTLSQDEPRDGHLYCKRTFDGWGCWNDTPAGATAYTPCPRFVPGFLPERHAHKVCNADGTWYRHPETNKTWSNYTTCVDQEDLSFRQRVNNMYIAGYSISLVALSVSLFIFCYFRSLQCTRTSIHKNLFLSFIINNSTWIMWYTIVIRNPHVLMKNEPTCQALHVLVHYSLVCNYFWMFCEGLYLHTILVVAFVSEDKIMKWFYLIGWGIPLPLIVIYAVLRGLYSNSLLFCWIDESVYLWILSGPVCLSMLLNLVFLINIIRVLVTKLRAVNSPDTNQTKKAVRATVILIPLLGLHYLLTPFRPEPRSPGEKVYEVMSAVVTSLQGLCVSLIFCFCNGEVTSVLARKWHQKRTLKETGKRMSYATTTISPCTADRMGKQVHPIRMSFQRSSKVRQNGAFETNSPFLQRSPSDGGVQWPEDSKHTLSRL